ncbi:SH3 domain-containing protein [Actinomadura chokoriensis]|uniref:SH3 domain-containing protein n=1 Tax=Actinomadura chokoriensis TaxID=454156 RepID=A0ABV4R3H4_9ACTN
MERHYKIATVLLAGVTGTGLVSPAALASAPKATSGVVERPAGGVINAYPKGKVISRHRLTIRAKPTTRSKALGSLKPGAVVDIKCWSRGQKIGNTRVWYRLGISTPEWVSGRYIKIIKGKVTHC